MCGIAGIQGNIEVSKLEQILEMQKQRGPDGKSIWLSPDKKTMFGHIRLAIMDVEGGSQPLANEDGTLWTIVNGEIYNYPELRKELESHHRFRTNSDSEIVLHLYEDLGPHMVKRLEGMFAIAIWSMKDGLFLARDLLGIKPLYYGWDEMHTLYFASEIKALCPIIPYIYEFPAGSFMLSHGNPQIYSFLPNPLDKINDTQTAIALLDQMMHEVVKSHLMAHVPLGVFLSGGLDSSLITALVKQYIKTELHSFSVGLEKSADIINAREVAKFIGTTHHERILTETEILAILPKVIFILESFDPALVRSAIPTYFVSELASKYVKVVLSGEGADELFAGYQYIKSTFQSTQEISKELLLITQNLHNSNLQRVDRLTMNHGLEARVPFLDMKMVRLAFEIANSLKINKTEKWILRKVAEKYLPAKVVWREKEKFAIGTGIGPLLENYAEMHISDSEFEIERHVSNKGIRTKEELLYYRYFKDHYNRDDIMTQMGRSRSLNPIQIWDK